MITIVIRSNLDKYYKCDTKCELHLYLCCAYMLFMKDRILKIIQHEGLTPSKFADIIGVQRSNVSHIFSGRSNPSLDFLSKILLSFPHISGDWLVTGKGNMLKTTTSAPKLTSLFDAPPVVKPEKAAPEEPIVNATTTHHPIQEAIMDVNSNFKPDASAASLVSALANTNQEDRIIEQIVIFYSDHSFTAYSPSRSHQPK